MRKVGLPLRKTEQRFTYGDYRSWPDDERWELLNGVAYNMCAAPTTDHQDLLRKLTAIFELYLKGKPCKFFFAPCDVFFPEGPEQDEDEVDTVVQPDLLVVCDKAKIRPKGIWGAPDLVAEILSPSTSRKDLREKFDLYQRSGVREYWVLDPAGRWLQQYVLAEGGLYGPEVTLERKGVLVCEVLPGLQIDTAGLWENL